MKLAKYLLPIICGVLLSTMRADPIYTVDTSYGVFELTIDTTSFDADSAALESMPWWGNVDLTYALSSTLNADYGYNGSNLAVFAIDPAVDFAPAADLNGNPVADDSQDIAVNTNNPAIHYPYISDVDPDEVLPYVVLAGSPSSAVPDTSSTLLILSFAVASVAILRRRAVAVQR